MTLSKAKRVYCDTKWGALAPFWRTVAITDVTPKKIREYYAARRKRKTQYDDAPKNGTLGKDRTLLRQILAFAIEDGQLTQIPPLPSPGAPEKSPRPWLTHDEFYRVGERRQQSHRRRSERSDPPVA